MSQLKLGALLSYINLALTNVIGIVLTPYTIRILGKSDYGLYTLIGAFVGYLSILDLGLNNAITRFVAKYRVEGDKNAERNFLATALLLYGLITFLVCILGAVLYLNINILFSDSLSVQQIVKGKKILLVLILNVEFTLWGGALTSICTGYERFVFPRIVIIVKYLLRSGLVLSLLYFGGDALTLSMLDTCMSILLVIATICYVFFRLNVKIKLIKFDVRQVKEIFQYSFWIFVFAIVYQFQWRTGHVILGINSNTVLVAIYAVGVMLGIYFTLFGNVINGLLLPKAVKAIYSGLSDVELTQLMIKIGRISLILLLYILGAFIVVGKDFIHLWVGESFKNAWLIALLIMIGYIIPISQGFGHAILEAKKLVRFKALAFLVCCAFGNLIGAYLSYSYGAVGMITGLFAGLVLLVNAMNIYYHKRAGLNMLLFFKNAYLPFLLPFFIIVAFCYIANGYIGVSWVLLLAKTAFYSVLYFIGLYLLSLNTFEKNMINKQLRIKTVALTN